MSKICQNCYSKIKDEHQFCTQCGKEILFPEYNKSKIEDIEENNNLSNEVKDYNDKGWLMTGIICFSLIIFMFNIPKMYKTSNNTNHVQKELSKVEINEAIKSELSLEEKSTLFKEAKKDFNTKNYDSSILKFNKLLGLNYKLDEVNFYLGQNWYMKKVYAMAVVYYKKSSLLNIKAAYMPTLLLNSVISFENIKDMENAKKSYTTLIQFYPSSNESKIARKNNIKKEKKPLIEDEVNLFKEAKRDFDIRNYSSAIPKYEKLIEISYKPAESNFYLGEIWYMRKKYDLAISHFKKSAVLYDKAAYMPTLLLHSAISFENIKDIESAKNFYTTLIELYPSSDESKIARKNNINKENNSIMEKLTNLYKKSENDSDLEKSVKNTSSVKYDNDISKDTYSQPTQILPNNGEIRDYSYLEKIAPLNIKTSPGANYLVKLKDAYNKETIMTIFIIGGNELTINVPLGSFEITYASGNKWYGYDYLFGDETSYSKADEIFNFRNTGYQISGYTISLYRVSNGNLNTLNINKLQF